MIKKKYIIVLSVVVLILVVISLSVSLLKSNIKRDNTPVSKNFAPEFLSAAELNSFRIATSTKAEVIKRDQTGKVIIYRIIHSDSDIVNPDDVLNK